MAVQKRYTQPLPDLMLHNGDSMKREDFHRAYCQMPDGYSAELIGGIVFEPSPVSYTHGQHHTRLCSLFDNYAEATPGVELADNATVILSDEDEMQPDLFLRISHNSGGQSRETDDHYIEGAPELVAEIAYSSRAIDLHFKKERYTLAGVQEYIVVCLQPKRLFWFDLRNKRELQPDSSGVFKSVIYPGLWIHEKGLLELERELTSNALKRGLKSHDHKTFAAKLAEEAQSK